MEKLPKISIVTCTYNGERVISEFLSKIFSQDYPKNNMEIILADGGSTDKTLEIIEKFRKKYPKIIKFIHNPKQYSIGKGNGMDIATKKASGEIIVQLDQDNILIQKSWLRRMIEILVKNKNISAVQSRYYTPEGSSATDKYVNSLGIEDPFASNYSLNAQIALNPKKFKYNESQGFFVYEVNKNNFYYAGDNGFAIRRKDFIESGGYTQDIDNFYRMALSKKKYKIAVPKDILLHHKTTTSFLHMIKKRSYYAGHYLLKNYGDRNFYWFSLKNNSFKQNSKFVLTVVFNLLFVPGLIQGIKMSLRTRNTFWFIHPFALFFITLSYVKTFFYSKFFKKQKEASI